MASSAGLAGTRYMVATDLHLIPTAPLTYDPSICSTKCQSGCNFGTDGEPSHLPTRAITALREEGGKNMCGAGVAEHVRSVEPWEPPQPVSDFENLKRSRNRGRSGSDRLHQRPHHQTRENPVHMEPGKNPEARISLPGNKKSRCTPCGANLAREKTRSFFAPLPGGGRRNCTCVHNESAHDIEGHRRGKQAPREGLPTGVLPQPPRRRAQWNPVSRSSVIRREGVFER